MLAIFLDTETNGLNFFKHRTLEIAFKILDLRSDLVMAQYESVVYQTPEDWAISDPDSLKVNGFSYEDVLKGKKSQIVSQEIIDLFMKLEIRRKEAVFICQNPSFDRAFFSQLINPDIQEKLQWPYYWLDLASMYWNASFKKGVFPWKTGFSKDNIALAYGLPLEAKPHRAMNGVNHLMLCYHAVVAPNSSKH